MMKLLKTTLLSVLALAIVGAGTLALAMPTHASSIKVNPGDIGYNPTVTNASSSTLSKVMNTVYILAGMVAVLIIVIAGIMFVTSNGDSNRVSTAKQAILAALIGLVFIIFAFAITQFVIGRIGG